ncbi:MAG: flagellar biosynthetic protein FliO [Pseudomonadota bacterium]
MRILALVMMSAYLPAVLAAAPESEGEARVGQLSQPVGAGEVLQVFLALVAVLLLIGVAAWLLRRFSGGSFSRNGPLRLLASVSVGQRERLVLVQAGETQLLLGVAQGSIRTLHVFDKPVVVNGDPPPGGERFAERLAQVLNRSSGGEK